jgi:hypothetical protein
MAGESAAEQLRANVRLVWGTSPVRMRVLSACCTIARCIDGTAEYLELLCVFDRVCVCQWKRVEKSDSCESHESYHGRTRGRVFICKKKTNVLVNISCKHGRAADGARA